MYCVYIIRSLKDGTHYYGSTSDVRIRIREHNAGKAKFTKGHRPYELIYSETFHSKHEALARERFFKSINGYNWLRVNGVIK